MTARLARSFKQAGLVRLALLLPIAVATILATAVALTGAGQGYDEGLRTARDQLRSRAATGSIVVVEIDAHSLSSARVWPWPRVLHARLVDEARRGGAALVAFDIDFSAPSDGVNDGAFAKSLSAFGGSVVLPTFRQLRSSGSERFVENFPLPQFRKNAIMGAVNVRPDADGQLRNYIYGTVTAGVPRPSIAALLADSSGTVGESFRIDGAIEPGSLPRVSAVDLIEGRVAPSTIRGKRLLVGGTAIELGDRYALPGHGVLPGVVVQALAAETLLQATDFTNYGSLPALLVAFAVIGWSRRWHRPSIAFAVAVAAILASPLVLETSFMGTADVVPALVLIAVYAALRGVLMLVRNLHDARTIDVATGLANLRALAVSYQAAEAPIVVAIRLKNYGEMATHLSDVERATLIARVVDRLRLGLGIETVFAIEPATLAVLVQGTDCDMLIEQVEGTSALFRGAIDIGSRNLLITPAFGIAESSRTGIGATELAMRAIAAARSADSSGHRWSLHNDTLASDADRSLVLLADVERALTDGSIHVLFQPKWSIAEGRVTGAEALVRWRHPELGPVSPELFIPLLEANQRIADLTLFVLDSCTRQQAVWRTRGHRLNVAVNISAALLDDAEFVTLLHARINEAQDLTLEVTESAALSSASRAIEVLAELKASGVRISIDDYGTGQSTLSYLKTFPANEVKIDKSFVTRIRDNASDRILVRSTIDLAHELGLWVVAEGVEDEACLTLLAEFGCDTAQGWHIGRPMDGEALATLIEAAADPGMPLRAAA